MNRTSASKRIASRTLSTWRPLALERWSAVGGANCASPSSQDRGRGGGRQHRQWRRVWGDGRGRLAGD